MCTALRMMRGYRAGLESPISNGKRCQIKSFRHAQYSIVRTSSLSRSNCQGEGRGFESRLPLLGTGQARCLAVFMGRDPCSPLTLRPMMAPPTTPRTLQRIESRVSCQPFGIRRQGILGTMISRIRDSTRAWRNGRRYGLKHRWGKLHAGSTPAARTAHFGHYMRYAPTRTARICHIRISYPQ